MPSKTNCVFAGPPVHGCPFPTTRLRVPPGFTRSTIPETALAIFDAAGNLYVSGAVGGNRDRTGPIQLSSSRRTSVAAESCGAGARNRGHGTIGADSQNSMAYPFRQVEIVLRVDTQTLHLSQTGPGRAGQRVDG